MADADVAIVGYGPTGAMLANLLGLLDLRVAVLEREAGVVAAPRAVHFDGEVMRMFQAAGLAAEIAPPRSRPSGGMRYVNARGEIMIERKPALGAGPHGWAQNYLFHQPELEEVLRAGLARFPRVEVSLAEEAVLLIAGRDDVEIRTPRRSLRARYVVGCDGARSMVRQAIGGEHQDLGLHQPWLVVDVVLEREVGLPEQTVQYCDPARPVTFVKVVGKRRRWEIMLMPGDDAESIVRPENVWRLLAPWITPRDARLERAAVYTFHSLIATRWRHRRLLIAGDAAHQTPPFLGQGMCAGIRDAANLAWKLGRVLRGEAHESLLDTYPSEREPHVRVFIEQAVRLGGVLQTTDARVAEERDRRFRDGGKEEMVNLSPALGPGAHQGPPPAGTIFPQPLLPDGRRLDDAIGGYRFAVLCPAGLSVDTELPVVPIAGAEAIVLRPDRYVYGVAGSAGELARLVRDATKGECREPRAA